jgi:hypothetical protein
VESGVNEADVVGRVQDVLSDPQDFLGELARVALLRHRDNPIRLTTRR